MFENLVNTLEMRNYGVKAYEQFAQLCYKSVAEQPDYAIFFLSLSVLAEKFVRQYDESPLTITVSDAQKERILTWVDKAERVMNGSSTDQIKFLNAVTRDIMCP